MSKHPFEDTPQFKQQYGGGLGYGGNGLGGVSGADPLATNEDGRMPRRRRLTRRLVPSPEHKETTTVEDILDDAGLTEKQRFVIELRHGIRGGTPMTLRQIASLMGIDYSAVWQIEQAAKKKLHKTLHKTP